MAPILIAFSCGILSYFMPISCAVAVVVIPGFFVFKVKKSAALSLGWGVIMLLGYGYVCVYDAYHSDNLIKEYYNKKIMIKAKILTVPLVKKYATEFEVETFTLAGKTNQVRLGLAWYGKRPGITAGSVWLLKVRLIKPSKNSSSRIKSSNYLRVNKLMARGYVVGRDSSYCIQKASQRTPLNTLRQTIAWHIRKSVTDKNLAGFIIALSIGLRNAISVSQWQVFRATGTSHLVAVSGLHVGLVSMCFFWCVSWLWRRSAYLCLKIPAQKVATLAALIGSALYAILAGLSVPTMRALIMLGALLLGAFSLRNVTLWFRLLVAFVVVLVINPFVTLSASFWLSFFATGILGGCLCARKKVRTGIILWLKMQALISVGLLPITLLFFRQVSTVTVFTNLVAIPYVSFVILPLCLIALLSFFVTPVWASYCWVVLANLLEPLWLYLSWFAKLSFALWHYTFLNVWGVLSVSIAALLCLTPKGTLGRGLVFIFVLTLLLSN